MAEATLEVRGLAKSYGDRRALVAFDLTAHAGRPVALVGPNGAGKTTSLRCIAGILRPDAGTITFRGQALGSRLGHHLSYAPQEPELYTSLSVAEHMRFIALAYRVSGWRERTDELLERFGLSDRGDDLPRALSGGMRRKLSVAMGLLHQAEVMLLDEPFNGLDPRATVELAETISQIASSGAAVVVSTHLLAVAARFAEEVFITDQGRTVASGSLDELREVAGADADADLESVFLALTEPADG